MLIGSVPKHSLKLLIFNWLLIFLLKYVQLVNLEKELKGVIFKWIKHLDNIGNSALSKY